MPFYHKIKEIPFFENTIVTIGTFDGIHLGHQEIIRKLLEISKQHKARHLLITFDPHPLTVLTNNQKPVLLITTNQEKKSLFLKYHIENVLFLPFNRKLAKKSASDFIQTVLKHIGLNGLLVGFNHTLGRDRSGTIETLNGIGERFDFFVQSIPPVQMDRQNVSSTGIRQIILSGDVKRANQWLGRPYSLQGNVISGKRVGRDLGFPTANLEIPKEKLIPRDGVYAVLIHYASRIFAGLANIGQAPTIPGKTYGIEIYIDNFKENIYNKQLEIKFIKHLRDEMKFISSEMLVQQIKKDLKEARVTLAPYVRR